MSLGTLSVCCVLGWLMNPTSRGRYAASCGVHLYTFDSESELQKIANADPSAKLLVRLTVANPLAERWVCSSTCLVMHAFADVCVMLPLRP